MVGILSVDVVVLRYVDPLQLRVLAEASHGEVGHLREKTGAVHGLALGHNTGPSSLQVTSIKAQFLEDQL